MSKRDQAHQFRQWPLSAPEARIRALAQDRRGATSASAACLEEDSGLGPRPHFDEVGALLFADVLCGGVFVVAGHLLHDRLRVDLGSLEGPLGLLALVAAAVRAAVGARRARLSW